MTAAWTPADAAELDVLTWELVDVYFDHLEQCETCQANRRRRGEPCVYVQSAIAIVVDWRQRRQLLTRAEQLRIDQAQHALDVAREIAEVAA